MINRRVTRVVLNSTEVTSKLTTPNAADYVPVLTTSDALYLGYVGKFASRYVQVSIANAVVSALTVEYWDGTAWVAVDDLIDQTAVGGATLAQSGFISWVNKDNWAESSLAGVDVDVQMFWVRIKVSVNLTPTASIKSILNLFSDDALLRGYFPELVSDTNYLPSGKSNFLDQHVSAKDLVVLRLKQRKLISHESQILEPNDVAVAATYAAAMLILQPIATSEAVKSLLAIAQAGFDNEISKVDFAIDADQDGTVSEQEREQISEVWVVRR